MMENPTTWTGFVVLLSLVIIAVTASLSVFRRYSFELFYYMHHMFIVFYVFLMLHGSFCFIKKNDGTCHGSNFWKYAMLPILIYGLERLHREIDGRRKVDVVTTVQHSGDVMEVRFLKRSWIKNGQLQYKPGQYVFLNCPSISPIQWHPFSLTSSKFQISCCALVVLLNSYSA